MRKGALVLLLSSLLLTGCYIDIPNENTTNNATQDAIKEFNDFVTSINLNEYRNEEKQIIETLINKIKEELKKEDISVNEVNSLIKTLKTKLSELKTDAYYDELELKELNTLKKGLIESLPKITNRYRDEEKGVLESKKIELINQIDAIQSKEELINFSTKDFEDLLEATKDDANYIMKELESYDVLSQWPTVTENKNKWTFSEKEVKTNSVAYALDQTTYSKNMSFEMSVSSSSNIKLGGVLIANQSVTGNGLDGYLVNIVSDQGNEFVQVYQLTNAYCSYGQYVCDYIGGWVYPGKTNGTTFRIEIEDNYLKIFEKDSDVNGGEVVDLTRGGRITLSDTYHLGLLNWDGAKYTIKISNIVTENSVSGIEKAKQFYYDYASKFNLEDYSSDNKKIIEEATKTVETSKSYEEILAKLEEAKVTFPKLKTLSYDNAVEIMDHIFSKDNSTQSAWDLVVEHAMCWDHEAKTNSVTTSGLAGWQLTKETFVDFEMVLEIDVATPINPYTGVLSKSFLFGADLADDPMKFKGFAISIYNNNGDNWVQISYNNGSADCATQFLGGVIGNYENVRIKVQVKNKTVKLYNENTNLELCGGGFWPNEGVGLSIPNYEGGKLGIYDWTNIKSTFTIHSFKTL